MFDPHFALARYYTMDSGLCCTGQFDGKRTAAAVSAPAAVSLIPCAGGVGTGLSLPPPLHAPVCALTPTMANTKHTD